MDIAWAQLVSLTELESSEIQIIKDKFVIGRNSDCDLPHAGNRLVSGIHCYIERNQQGKVWLYDTSTNGTLLNLSIKLSKGECRELHHGDEIHIVHKKSDTTDDIGYMFQDMEALRAESSSDLEETQEYTQDMNDFDATLSDENVNTTPSPQKKKKSTDISPGGIKRIVPDSQLDKLSSLPGDEKNGEKSTEPAAGTLGNNSDKPDKVPSTSKVKQDQDNVSGKSEEKTELKPTGKLTENPVVPIEPEEDAIAETLVCIICQELLYDCISLQPCMHSFCAGCYSEWMEQSQECPSCRLKVARINKNHIVNNLVEAYLKTKPDKRRPEAELKELDGKNKITRDMLYPAKKSKVHSDDESFSDSYTDDDGGGYEGDISVPGPVFSVTEIDVSNVLPFDNCFNDLNQAAYFGAATYGTLRPSRAVCRQCTGYKALQNQMVVGPMLQGGGAGAARGATTPGPSTAAGPSTTADDPDAKTFPTAPDYICPINGNHVLCLCCKQPMPERRNPNTPAGTVPPQQCYVCFRSFCHAYWGCLNPECHGCIARFKDLNFGKKCLTSLILDNAYESKVLEDFMKDQGISVQDLFKECLAKVNTGEYVFTNLAKITSYQGLNTPMCYSCGILAFKELAYFYRRDIPADKLPTNDKLYECFQRRSLPDPTATGARIVGRKETNRNMLCVLTTSVISQELTHKRKEMHSKHAGTFDSGYGLLSEEK